MFDDETKAYMDKYYKEQEKQSRKIGYIKLLLGCVTSLFILAYGAFVVIMSVYSDMWAFGHRHKFLLALTIFVVALPALWLYYRLDTQDPFSEKGIERQSKLLKKHEATLLHDINR